MLNNPELDQLASEFFKEFARSEYALKAAGFHNGKDNGSIDAKADWSKFAKKVEALIQAPDSAELSAAVDFLFNQPPKKQMICNGKLRWCDVPPNQKLKADDLLIYVRRVRNNLFHGGKFNVDWGDPERSAQLIQNSLVIIKACVNFVDITRDAYHS